MDNRNHQTSGGIVRFSKKMGVAAAAAAAVAAVSLVNAAPASAADVAVQSVHRGTDRCFNWSYDDGKVSTIVNYHNTCRDTHVLDIHWSRHNQQISVAGGKSGQTKSNDKVTSISQLK
jgi:hypothetical protein